MSSSEPVSRRRVPIRLAVAAAVVTGVAGTLAGAAIADEEPDRGVEVPRGGREPTRPRVDSDPDTGATVAARSRGEDALGLAGD